jgi:hypothetical protein
MTLIVAVKLSKLESAVISATIWSTTRGFVPQSHCVILDQSLNRNATATQMLRLHGIQVRLSQITVLGRPPDSAS